MRALRFQRGLRLAAICAAALLLCAPSWAYLLYADAPPGFENLDRPQRTLIDVVVLGRTVRGVAVSLHGATLQFEEPLRLLAEIDQLADPQSVLDSVSAPLPTNADLVCRENVAGQENCGRLEPRIAGVIYDRQRFIAELFINAAFIKPAASADIFLPQPQKGLFAFSRLLGSASGSRDGATHLALYQDLQIGAGTTRLMATTFLSNERSPQLDALRLERDHKLWRYTLGRFFAPSLASISDLNMVGLSMRTHTDGLVNKKLTDPGQLEVFLNRRGQVRVLREGRLLFSQTFEPGHHSIDPQRMPDGSYQVTFQILEEGSALREETRFFVKEYDVPSAQTPFYFIDAGRVVDFTRTQPDADDTYILRTGARWRMSEKLALGGDLVGGERAQLAEVNATRLGERWSARWALFASGFGDTGIDSRLTAQVGQWNYAFAVRKNWSASAADDRDFLYELGRSHTRVSASIAGPIGKAIVSSNASLTDSDAGRSRSANLQVRYPFSLPNASHSDALFNVGYMNGAVTASLAFTARFGDSNRPIELTAGYRAVDGSGPLQRTERSGSFQGASFSGNFEPLDGHRMQTTASAERTPQGHNMQAWGDYESELGRLSAASSIGRLHGVETGSYDVSFQTGLYGTQLLSANRAFGAGGGGTGNAALLVAIDGSAPDVTFQVYVDGVQRGTLRAQEQITIALPAYRTYDVRLSAAGGRAVAYDKSTRQITLFPGNVAQTRWHTTLVVPAFGRILASNGEPLANVQIAGAATTVFTDERGYFTAELPIETALEFLDPRAGCKIPIAIEDPEALFVRLGTLHCPDPDLQSSDMQQDRSTRITEQ